MRFGLLCHRGLQVAVFKHRLDDEVTTGQIGGRSRGLDTAQQCSLVGGSHAALFDAVIREFLRIGLAQVGLFACDILEHRADATAGLRPGDTRAHHAGTQDADFLGFVFGIEFGPRLPALDRIHVEKRGDHGACIAAHEQLGEVTRLNTQGGVQIDLQTFDHAGHDGLRGRVQAARLGLEHGWRHRQHGGDFGVGRRAARHLVVLGFPGVLRSGRCGHPVQRSLAHGRRAIGPGLHQSVHQTHGMRLGRGKGLAFHHVRHGRQQAQVPRHLGDATGAGQEAQRDFGQPQQDAGIVHRHAEVAQQRHFKTAAQRRAVQASGNGHAERFKGAELLFGAFDPGEHLFGIGVPVAHRAFEVSPGKKGLFVGRQDDALERRLLCGEQGHQFGHVLVPLHAHGVDGAFRLVKRDGGDLAKCFVRNR